MSELAWQRTPLITIAFFLLKQLKQFVTNISNLIPVLAAVFVAGKNAVWLPFALAGGYLVFTIINAVLQQRFFLYAIADDAVHIRSGLFNRQHLTLKYERIQQAEIHEAWYFRPFKLTILSVDSAGSAGKEVMIPGLTMPLAQELRQRMLEAHDDTASSRASSSSTSSQDETELEQHFPVSEIIRAGIIDNKLFVLLAVLIYPISQLDLLDDYVVPWVQANVSWLSEDNAWLLVSGAVVAGLAILFLLAIIVSLITYHDLKLSIRGERFQAKSGALSIRTLSFRYPKLQAVYLRRNLRARLLKRSVVRVSQLQPRQAQGGAQQGGQQFILPVVDADFLARFRLLLRLPDSAQVHWQRLSNLALLGPSVWLGLLAPVAAGVLFFALDSGALGLVLTALGWLLLQTLVILRWRNYGYSFVSSDTQPKEQWFVVRRGIFSRNENWYPRHKVQQIDVEQGPWLRLLGFSHLVLHTAAGSESIEFLARDEALRLQEEWTQEIARNHRRWM
ncbi:PH domain-containing protein [Pseudidiomarina sp. CB1]|uniref:PH domain-containing protein n=1 Tax=Pseudidiomarina sp. CB1 TaxID=2972484 RepID=UPI0021636BBF|nr:PH domain-containing protein [Pseudidiomarina sp. CB1]